MNKAHPTRYRGVQYRSRLEARWAAFFELLEWPFQYEPLDLRGYCPDFLLKFDRPVVVEVKPLIGAPSQWHRQPLGAYAIAKLNLSGWQGDALLVGSTLDDRAGNDGYVPSGRTAIHGGALLIRGGDNGHDFSAAPFGFMACCGGPTDVVRAFGCLKCGHHDSGPLLVEPGITNALWGEAGNRVQWRGAGSMTSGEAL